MKDLTPFEELWAQFILEESRIKVKDDIGLDEKYQAFLVWVKKLKKGNFGMSKKKYKSKVKCFRCNEFRHFKRDNPKKQKGRSEAHGVEVVGEPEKKENK